MTDKRPVLLLDVDGVLNASGHAWGDRVQRGEAHSGGFGYTLQWSGLLIQQIRRLHRDGNVDIRWSTTWCDDKLEVERVLHLPSFPVAFTGCSQVPGKKLRAAWDVVMSGRPLIWVDDDAIPTNPSLLACFSDAGSLLIRPNSRIGMTPADIVSIDAFIEAARLDGPEEG